MNKDAREIEQRMINILRRNSRANILELADELNISRITASKTLSNLISSGKITHFTVFTEEDQKNLVIIHLKTLENIDEELILEQFELFDGTYFVVVYYESLPKLKVADVIDIKFAREKRLNNTLGRVLNVKCDYCGKIMNKPNVVFELGGKTMYACCPNCEKDLRKRETLRIESQ